MSSCKHISKFCNFCFGYFPRFPYVGDLEKPRIKRAETGYLFEYTDIVCKILNLHCCYARMPHHDYGAQIIDKTANVSHWDGLIGDVLDGKIEGILPFMTMTEKRANVVDFSQPIMISKIYFAFRIHTKTSAKLQVAKQTSNFLAKVLPIRVWLILLSLLAFVGFVFFLFSRVFGTKTGKSRSKSLISEAVFGVLYALSLFTGQGKFRQESGDRNSMRCLYLTWTLGAWALTSIYASSLASRIIVPSKPMPFNSAEELAELIRTGKYKLVVETMSQAMFDRDFDDLNKQWRSLRLALQEYPPVLAGNRSLEDFISQEESASLHFVGWKPQEYWQATVFEDTCNIGLIEDTSREVMGFTFKKDIRYQRDNTTMVKAVNRVIKHLSRVGALNLLLKSYRVRRPCQDQNPSLAERLRRGEKEKVVTLSKLYWGIGIFVFGTGLAASMFVSEQWSIVRGTRRYWLAKRKSWFRSGPRNVVPV